MIKTISPPPLKLLIISMLCVVASLRAKAQSITIDAPSSVQIGQTATLTINPPCGTVTQVTWETSGGSIAWQDGGSASITWSSTGSKYVSASFTYRCGTTDYYGFVSTNIEVTNPPPPPCPSPVPMPSISVGEYHNGLLNPYVNISNLSPCVSYDIVIYYEDGGIQMLTVSGMSSYQYDGGINGRKIMQVCVYSSQTGMVCS